MSVRRSLAWSATERYLLTAINIVATVVLSRLLTPQQIGVYAVAYSVVGLSQSLRDFGTTNYLVQESELTDSRVRTAFGMTLLTGLFLGSLVLAGSAPLGTLYRNPDLAIVLRILSLHFFLWPLGAPILALLKREMRFDVLARISVLSCLFQPGTSILLAWLGYGYFGLAWGSVVGVAAAVVVTTLHRPRETWMWPSLSEWRRVGVFGMQAAAASLLWGLTYYTPDIIIGRLIGFSAAGFYSRAAGAINLFVDRVWGSASQVALAEFARRSREREGIVEGYLKTLAFLTGIGWPFFLVLSLAAFPTVRLLFGPQWDPCVPLLQVLAIGAMIELLSFPAGAALIASGQMSRELKSAALNQLIRLGAIAGACPFGLEAVAVAYAFSSLLTFPVFYIQLHHAIGLRLPAVMSAIQSSVAVTVAAAALPLAVFVIMGPAPEQPMLALVLAGIGASLGWLAAIYGFHHPLRTEISGLFAFFIARARQRGRRG